MARNEPFEVHVGRFCGAGWPNWKGSRRASFTTDANGTYRGRPGVQVPLPLDEEIILNARGVSQFIVVPEQTGFMTGRWQIDALCPQGAVELGMLVREHRTDGTFRGESTIRGHPGCYDGRVSGGGLFMNRQFSRSQQWTTNFPGGDRSRLSGRVADPTHAPCTFEARRVGQ